ncbi:unnamed protein product [Merluccius merluccius]
MSTVMGYEPYYPTSSSSSSSSSYRRWYAEVTTPTPQVTAAKRGRAPHSVYSSHASPLSSSTRLRYSSSPSGRVFQPSSTSYSSTSSTLERELSQAAQISSEFREVRTRERAQLQDLNDRFAGFVERVHELEQRNRALEADLDLLRRRHAQPPRLGALYEQEARTLRAGVDRAQAERQEALGQRENLERTLDALQARHEEETLAREEMEARLQELRGGADQAALAQAEAEKRVEALLDELAFLKKIHEGEVAELQAQAQLGARMVVESEATTALDLSGALREIRAQYEGLAAKNVQSAEDWFRGKVGSLSESVAQHSHAVRSSKGEAGEVRNQLQARLLEIDACRGVNHSLEKQLHETEDKQVAEIAAMQDMIEEQESELSATKQEMTRYLKEYQDLLNVKMALDIEIAAYRKLLEGEESRFNVGMGGASSMYSSHTLSVAPPSFSRPMFSGLSSGAPYLTTSRVHMGSTLTTSREVVYASRSHKAEATPQPEEKEELEEEKEEEKEQEEEKVEGGEEEEVKEEGGEEDAGDEKGEEEEKKEEGDKEESEEMGGEVTGGDEDEEKQEMKKDTEEGGEGGKKKEEEEKPEDKEVTEVVAKEASDDRGEIEAVKAEEKKQEEKADGKQKTEQEDEVKPDMKEENEGGKAAEPEKKSKRPQQKEEKDEVVTEKTKEKK